jgi:hypothetical protein
MQDTNTLTANPEKDKIQTLFNQFKREKKFLENLSDRTLQGYQEAFNRWQAYVGESLLKQTYQHSSSLCVKLGFQKFLATSISDLSTLSFLGLKTKESAQEHS